MSYHLSPLTMARPKPVRPRPTTPLKALAKAVVPVASVTGSPGDDGDTMRMLSELRDAEISHSMTCPPSTRHPGDGVAPRAADGRRRRSRAR
jgi:hypothetical protein